MQCTKCNSENTQRLEVVYHGGTQDINTTGSTVGGGYGGAFGIGGAVTKTSGQSQSMLAQRAAPPTKKSYKYGLIMLFSGLLLMSGGTTGTVLSGLFFTTTGGILIYGALQFNSKKFPSLYQTWLDSWLCNKCGTIYQHA